MRFPCSLSLLTQIPPLTLVGLGVRKVSFLRVKVYSAGFYLEEAVSKGLHNIEGWHVSPTSIPELCWTIYRSWRVELENYTGSKNR